MHMYYSIFEKISKIIQNPVLTYHFKSVSVKMETYIDMEYGKRKLKRLNQ